MKTVHHMVDLARFTTQIFRFIDELEVMLTKFKSIAYTITPKIVALINPSLKAQSLPAKPIVDEMPEIKNSVKNS